MSNKVKVPGGAFYAGDGLTVDQTTRTVSAGGGSSVSTPDWNQNDATASDYIKNRPFYTGDTEETEIIPVTTVTFQENEGRMASFWPESFDLVDGQTYTVSWDGTDHVCDGTLFSGIPILGNLGILGAGPDTGEPFIFYNQGQWVVASTESATEYVIGIKAVTIPIVTLDEKYLPKASEEGYGIIKTSDIVSAYNFPSRAPHDQMVDAIAAFKTGNASIVWDGQKVINASYNSSNDTIAVKFADEPLEFLTYTNNNGLYVRTLGSPTYREVQVSQLRIVNENDKNVYTVLSAEGESSNVTLNVKAHRISILGLCGISETEMILKSSTSGSTKKFKITVDDSGTICATEVTA